MNNIFAGVDVGSATAKVVILKDGRMLTSSIIPTGYDMSQAGERVLEEALKKSSLQREALSYIGVTGYGRHNIPFRNKVISEIMCHAKGAFNMLPRTKVVIDIGGQDSKIIWLDTKGNVVDFTMNDKCAAGTGKFLELIAATLDMKVEELGDLSLRSNNPCSMSSTCAIFAESEVVGLRARGVKREDIISGVHQALALRITSMGTRRGFQREVFFTGGVAKNQGMQHALEKRLGLNIVSNEDCQLMGAFGAALLASESNSN